MNKNETIQKVSPERAIAHQKQYRGQYPMISLNSMVTGRVPRAVALAPLGLVMAFIYNTLSL